MGRKSRSYWIVLSGFVLLAACSQPGVQRSQPAAYPIPPDDPDLVDLGEAIFFDQNLSIHRNQSCAACHEPSFGFGGPDPEVNAGGGVYEGSIPGRFGNRKAPSSAYATESPIFRCAGSDCTGGNFWDGRATGERLGNAAAEQAQGPFLNPAEQALRDAACVVYRVSVASYAPIYTAAWGKEIMEIPFPTSIDSDCAVEGPPLALSAGVRKQVNREYDHIAYAIAAYEGSPKVNAFTSKFDAWRNGQAELTAEELKGFALFQGKGKCATCHPADGDHALFTDFSYDNLGLPVNPMNPSYVATGFRDLGLGDYLKDAAHNGKFRAPTLRNVDRRPNPAAIKAYMHNGVLRSLEQVVHFYNTRDVLPRCASPSDHGFGVICWPAPEVAANLNTEELGNLGLSAEEERLIVTFLKTLSDGYTN